MSSFPLDIFNGQNEVPDQVPKLMGNEVCAMEEILTLARRFTCLNPEVYEFFDGNTSSFSPARLAGWAFAPNGVATERQRHSAHFILFVWNRDGAWPPHNVTPFDPDGDHDAWGEDERRIFDEWNENPWHVAGELHV